MGVMGLKYTIDKCKRCPELVENRTQIVNGAGSGDRGIMFVGEAPGAQEDREGEPFVGKSGGVLARKLERLGVSRDEVRITNSVRCRPPDNRDPHKEELANCKGYLEAEIDIFSPEIICTLGRVPTSNLLGENVRMGAVIGEVHEVGVKSKVYPLVPCYHPAAMLYDQSKEKDIDRVLSIVVEMGNSP